MKQTKAKGRHRSTQAEKKVKRKKTVTNQRRRNSTSKTSTRPDSQQVVCGSIFLAPKVTKTFNQ